jgi:hypothetical protein
MDEKIVIQQRPPKSPAAAGILSVILPGVGNLYNGLVNKGLLQLVVFAGLLVVLIRAAMSSNVLAIVFTAMMLAGFWFYQIIDSVNSAKALNESTAGQKPEEILQAGALPPAVTSGSIFWGIVLIVVGILVILVNFDVMKWDTLWDLWPVLVIILGLRLVFSSLAKKNGRAEK